MDPLFKKEEISEIIKLMIDNIEEETMKDEKTEYFYKIISEQEFDMKSPEKYSILCQFNINMSINMALKKILKEKLENFEKLGKNEKEKIIHLFTNYSFYNRHVEKLIKKKTNTTIYISDRSRSILKTYYNYLLNNIIPEDTDEYQWWRPPFGTNENWIEFINGIYDLYYGNINKYFVYYDILSFSKIKEKPNTKNTLT